MREKERDGIEGDILSNIMKRLPARSFAAASCVNSTWNKASSHILSRPLLASALSLNPDPLLGVEEVIHKVLSKPIRPHFAIAFVGSFTCLDLVHALVTEKLGSNTPLITSAAGGLIGKDALTNRFKEVKWDLVYEDDVFLCNDFYRGILLAVGFVPGLKTTILPLLQTNPEPHMPLVDKFVSDIQSYSISVSGDSNPVGVMMFGNHSTDLRPILAELDQKMGRETFIIGDASTRFICTNNGVQDYDLNIYSQDHAVGLVFAKDNQNHYEGEIKFHVGISSGIMPCGPRLEVVEAGREEGGSSSWFTVRSEGEAEILDASAILDTLGDSIDDEIYALYIGLVRERIPNDGENPTKYLEFHELLGTEQEAFIVSGIEIKTGDSFILYHSDSDTAKSSCINVFNDFNVMANPRPTQVHRRRRSNSGQSISADTSPTEEEVFGGIIFASSNRGDKFFGEPKVDSMPFRENFPRVPFGGTFCIAPFGRPAISGEENGETRCPVQVFSTVYLAMTYVPSSTPHH